MILALLIVLALASAAVLFLYSGVNQYFVQNSRMARRLKPGSRLSSVTTGDAKLVPDEGVLESVEKYLTPKDPKRLSHVQKQLMFAGYRDPSAVKTYYAWKWGVALGGLFFSSLVFATMMTRVSPFLPIAGMILVVVFSYFAADMWVLRKRTYRQMDMEKSFPDALDLMLVCIEAGHGLDQAMHRVARELNKSAPVLSEELLLIVNELRAGKMRDRVLSDFAERTNISDIAAFVTVIKQADKFGVSIADTLRVYAKEMRNKRYMRAEEKANMMPIKLALGAIAFTIPPVIVILIGPSVILILREMVKATSSGGVF
jgi:tight adherence protein C